MLSICSASHDPFFNIALEEFLLHNRTQDFFILYINDPCVIIGKHQVVHREVNTEFIDKKKIPVIRRITGGGTVYHDRGNLNFSFIRQSKTGRQVDFRLYTKPVIDFLNTLGVKAIFEGKNDLTVDGLKVSGNAEHVFRERVLHHGTLLFDASLEDLKQSIKIKTDTYSTHAVGSNRSSVTNLKGRLRNIDSIEKFLMSMLNYFVYNIPDIQTYNFTKEDLSSVQLLKESKYNTWEWNYGYGPPYTFTSWIEINSKPYYCKLVVRDGIIWESEIEGDEEINAAGKKLIGCRHMYFDILKKLREEKIPITEYEVYRFF